MYNIYIYIYIYIYILYVCIYIYIYASVVENMACHPVSGPSNHAYFSVLGRWLRVQLGVVFICLLPFRGNLFEKPGYGSDDADVGY